MSSNCAKAAVTYCTDLLQTFVYKLSGKMADSRKMRSLQFACLAVAFSIAAAYPIISGKTISAASHEGAAEVEVGAAPSSDFATSALPVPHRPLLLPKEETRSAAYQIIFGKTMSVASHEGADETEVGSALSSSFATSALPVPHGPLLLSKEETGFSTFEKEQAGLEAALEAPEQPARTEDSVQDHFSDPTAPKQQNFSYLAYYVFSEIPPEKKPADTVLAAMKDLPVGTPIEEVKRAANAFGLDPNFMKAVAKIESGFNPKQRTGSYIGLFQLSNYEFKEYGSGNITDSRDNAIAGAYKFASEALLFEYKTGKKPTFSDLYLIHQQGWQGAAEHVSNPKRIAWKSMCATDEGKEKGERWCKLAIWRNTLPAIKHAWKSVDKLTSGAFVGMWRQRVADLYSHYAVAVTKN